MIYFGRCNSDGTPITNGEDTLNTGLVWWNTFTSPSAVRLITELGIYARVSLSGTASVRVALYNSAGTTLIAQTGAIAVSIAGSLSWYGATGLAGVIVPNTSYIIAVATKASTSTNLRIGSDSSGPSHSRATSSPLTYVDDGFPASLPASSTAADTITARAGGPAGLLMRRRRRAA